MLGDDHGYPCPHFLLSGGGGGGTVSIFRQKEHACKCAMFRTQHSPQPAPPPPGLLFPKPGSAPGIPS